jgi:putative PIN family toxin of toxin-antitoxin system
MRLLQIVIDTNVLVSGLRSRGGGSFRLLDLIGRGYFEINISVPLILEYEAVLLRQLPDLPISDSDVDDFLDYLCAVGQKHRIFYLWRPMLRDAGDEMLLELAVKAQCDYIVTYNTRNFAGSDQFGIKLATPETLLLLIEDIGL